MALTRMKYDTIWYKCMIYFKLKDYSQFVNQLKHNQFSFSLLLAPATGVDTASLSPHEVLPRVQSIVHRCGGGAEGAALESVSIQDSSSIRLWVDKRSLLVAVEPKPLTKRHRPEHRDT